jgi:hypothetical protein
MIDDTDRDLGTVLSYLVGRPVRATEIIGALGVSRSAYYVQREAGRLVTADNLLRLAAALGLNPIDLLVRFGMVDLDAVVDYAGDVGTGTPVPTASGKWLSRAPRLNPRLDAPPF